MPMPCYEDTPITLTNTIALDTDDTLIASSRQGDQVIEQKRGYALFSPSYPAYLGNTVKAEPEVAELGL